MTVNELALSCGLSRGTILYYESLGLLKPAKRTASNYRRYSEDDLSRLRQICIYRSAGLKLADILSLVSRPGGDAAAVLERRLAEIDLEIAGLRRHQHVILRLLQSKSTLRRIKNMTKDKWVEIMRATGFTEEDMHRWHVQFERTAPEDHQQFLEFLHIAPGEIGAIREWSRKGAGS
jgi:DNA-binding transcriptional MerR regulator